MHDMPPPSPSAYDNGGRVRSFSAREPIGIPSWADPELMEGGGYPSQSSPGRRPLWNDEILSNAVGSMSLSSDAIHTLARQQPSQQQQRHPASQYEQEHQQHAGQGSLHRHRAATFNDYSSSDYGGHDYGMTVPRPPGGSGGYPTVDSRSPGASLYAPQDTSGISPPGQFRLPPIHLPLTSYRGSRARWEERVWGEGGF